MTSFYTYWIQWDFYSISSYALCIDCYLYKCDSFIDTALHKYNARWNITFYFIRNVFKKIYIVSLFFYKPTYLKWFDFSDLIVLNKLAFLSICFHFHWHFNIMLFNTWHFKCWNISVNWEILKCLQIYYPYGWGKYWGPQDLNSTKVL